MKTRIIGIDPGFSGALSVIDEEEFAHLVDAPILKGEKNEWDFMRMHDLLRTTADSIRSINWRVVAVIERAQPMPGQGISSTFRYGGTYYAWLAGLAAHEIPYHVIGAAQWKKMLGLGSEKEDAVALAKRLYPKCASYLTAKKHHGRAEATLIGHIGRRLIAEGKL